MQIKLEALTYMLPLKTGGGQLDNIELGIEKGEYLGILGSSPEERTALLMLICGLCRPDEGRVLINGQPRKGKNKAAMPRIGYLGRKCEQQLFESSVDRELAHALRLRGMDEEQVSERIRKALACFGFDYEPVSQRSPLSFSQGERRSLAMAALLAAEPEILLLDEPFAPLDCRERERLLTLLDELNAAGVTVIVASDDADAFSQHARRVAVIDGGRIVTDGCARTVLSDYYELVRRGVAVPSVCVTAHKLWERGVNMPGNIILYEQFIDRLKIIMWRKNR